MGGVGSDIAVEASDAVMVSDDILRIDTLFGLCFAASYEEV
jgi:cation transport ATPase